MVEDPVREGYPLSGSLHHVTRFDSNECKQAEYILREADHIYKNAQEKLEQAENALRKTSNLRIELAEAEKKILSLVENSKKK
jgi:exonuclease VII small subunit